MLGAGTVLAIVGGAIASTASLLGAGYRVGLHAGKSMRDDSGCGCAGETVRMRQKMDRCLAAIDGVSLQSGALATIMATHGEAIPADCRRAVRRLLDTANLLTERLSRAAAETNVLSELARPSKNRSGQSLTQSQPVPAPESSVGCASPVSLSSTEIEQAAGLEESPKQTGAVARRYPYDCHQSITPWYGDEPEPAAVEQVLVRCHDISVEGISFFWPCEPDFEKVVITVGQGEDRKLMLANLMSSKPVYMHAEFKFLVGCRFIKRVT